MFRDSLTPAMNLMTNQNSVNITPVFPTPESIDDSGVDIDFDMINCTASKKFLLSFQHDLFHFFAVGDVNVVDDLELARQTVEINGDDSKIHFPTYSEFKNVALQLKNLDRFMKVVMKIRDSSKHIRTIIISNKRTTVNIDHNICQLPLEFREGWQYINIDLEDIVYRCFGTSVLHTVDIEVYGSTRIGKIYSQEKVYADAQLPAYLRLLHPSHEMR